MRPWFTVLSLSLALLNPSNLKADDPPLAANAGIAWPPQRVPADPPLPAEAGIAWPPQSVPAIQTLPAVPVVPPRAVEPQWLDIELLLGLPTEVRVQWAAFRGSRLAFQFEGIVGVGLAPVVDELGTISVRIAGVGGRVRWAVYNGERNAFVIKPGADVYGWFIEGAGNTALGGADVELLWWHNCGSRNRFGFELGADLGAFFGYYDHSRLGWPMVSAIVGLHF